MLDSTNGREGLVLYKVTPTLPPADKGKAKDSNGAKEARKRRKTAVFDGEGNEVLITMMCLKCRTMKPLTMFGLRKMSDGAIRNQPWCRSCRSGKKKESSELEGDQLGAERRSPDEP